MPKGKVIEARPKKRKTSQKSDDGNSVISERQRRSVDHPLSVSDGIRHSRSRHRGTGDGSSLSDFQFLNKTQKRSIIYGAGFALVAVCIGFGIIHLNNWYQSQLIKMPLNLPKIISDDDLSERSQSLFWGSYRPGLFFGMRHRSPNSLLFGLIWTVQDPQNPMFRHTCNQNDGIFSYNWLEHDGRSFGTQQIVDTHHVITVSFVKQPTDSVINDGWTVRVSAFAKDRNSSVRPLFMIAYFYYPSSEQNFVIHPLTTHKELVGLKGNTVELNDFEVRFYPDKNSLHRSFLWTHIPREDAILESLFGGLGLQPPDNFIVLTGQPQNLKTDVRKNAWFYGVTSQVPIKSELSDPSSYGMPIMEVVFTRSQLSHTGYMGSEFSTELSRRSALFHKNFVEKLNAHCQSCSERQINLTKIVVSNLFGGIGYFHGSSLIKSPLLGPDPVPNWPASLFTATPSRPMFPRGFLWDEGFHGLVMARWDPEIAMESVGHWLDLLNAEGWIAREQILGWESRAQVPAQFIVQSNTVANPPTLCLTIEALLDNLPKLSASETAHFRQWSMNVLPRLHTWYQWFNRTQIGPVPLSYRWRGRNPKEVHQLNPLTLSSGLDDYPRASHPSEDERHLDLRCWMTMFARVVARLASVVAQYLQTEPSSTSQTKLQQTRSLIAHYTYWTEQLSDQTTLDKLHWSDKLERYADYGLHTDSVYLKKPPVQPNTDPRMAENVKPIRMSDSQPSLQLVTSSFGYVNLFPLLLRILPPDSPRLVRLMKDLNDKDLTWSEFGLRSLGPKSPFYDKPNTPDDPPYWRGAIWINMNYLAVQSLRYYANHHSTPTNVAQEARRLATELGQNLIRTVFGELERTANLWEQYHDRLGKGQRAHPFAGWTTLISLIVADQT